MSIYTKDRYSRGLNTHNPDFTEVTGSLESLIIEVSRRLSDILTR